MGWGLCVYVCVFVVGHGIGLGDNVVAKRCVCGVGGCAERDRLRCGCDRTSVAGLWVVVQGDRQAMVTMDRTMMWIRRCGGWRVMVAG